MRDLEIRGAGNILGTAQSGHVGQVGYEMYLELLGQTVAEMKGEQLPPKIDPEIALKIEAVIPEEYVPDSRQRMNLYKRLSRAETSTEIDQLEDEILDLYGKPPPEKRELIEKRKQDKLVAEKKFKEIKRQIANAKNDDDEVADLEAEADQLRRQFVRITGKDISDVKYLLRVMGISYYESDGDAILY